ncbi:hypothetical protein HHK36_028938 [Tetracentron sinense]|uniref:Uncharacterized protein n=1 Tax=Tetracentron sinense TaxID=13715 RepID=A0A834YGR7_TETSI|nr:hypothetical protein HHK36_028938 [Tetracentron sinense]
MGKRKGYKKGSAITSGNQSAITLREEISGRMNSKGSSNNFKSVLKMQHLQNLAVWAGGEGAVPSLAAFLGHRLAACSEATGIPLDPSLFPCQRCETILQPGHNCTVRIETNKAKVQRRCKKSKNPTQNNVVYTCHFCSHRNLKRGTPKGYMKELYSSLRKSALELNPIISTDQRPASPERGIESTREINENMEEIISLNESEKGTKSTGEINEKMEEIISLNELPILELESSHPNTHLATTTEILVENSPATPLVRRGAILLEGKRRKRSKSGSKKPIGSESNSATMDAENSFSGSSKRRRKSWSSLKEISESSERKNTRNITNLAIPFFE